MKLVTTPMCEKILEFAEIYDYKVNKNPDDEDGDLAILLSESKIKMDSLSIKLNTFSQIKESIIEVSQLNKENSQLNENPLNEKLIFQRIENIFSKYPLARKWTQDERKKEFQKKNLNIKIKVYSKFLRDIVKDMGFFIAESDFDYIVFPDYMEIENHIEINNLNNLKDLKNNMDENIFISIPTHSNVPKDPIKRAEMRYFILNNISML